MRKLAIGIVFVLMILGIGRFIVYDGIMVLLKQNSYQVSELK